MERSVVVLLHSRSLAPTVGQPQQQQHVIKFIRHFVKTTSFPQSIATACSDTCRVVCLHGHPCMPQLEQSSALSVLQDWTKQENEDAEGVVSFSYRTKPEEPPDVQTIQKQMAIVAWQPGPNRIVQVPSQVSCNTSAIYCTNQHVILPVVTPYPVTGEVQTCPLVPHLPEITTPYVVCLIASWIMCACDKAAFVQQRIHHASCPSHACFAGYWR